jgi:hypothetical protein
MLVLMLVPVLVLVLDGSVFPAAIEYEYEYHFVEYEYEGERAGNRNWPGGMLAVRMTHLRMTMHAVGHRLPIGRG